MRTTLINLTDVDRGRLNGSHPRHILPPLELGYCASILEAAGFKVDFHDTEVDATSISQLAQRIRSFAADFAIVRVATFRSEWVAQALRTLRSARVPLIGIGPVVSTVPDTMAPLLDLVIVGECEDTLTEVSSRLKAGEDPRGGIAGTAWWDGGMQRTAPRNLITDVDRLPFPKHDYFLNRGYTYRHPLGRASSRNWAAVLTSRGCHGRCIFCSPFKRVSVGMDYRGRSPENILQEVRWLQDRGVDTIYFCDDHFTYDPQRVAEICERLEGMDRPIVWGMQSRIDSISLETAHALYRAGCRCINLGIESGNDRMLRRLGKEIKVSQVTESVRNCRRAGINLVGNFIIGAPGETHEDRVQSMELALKLDLDMIEVLFFTPYPGSIIHEHLRKKSTPQSTFNEYELPVSAAEVGVRAELERFQKEFYRRFYFRWSFILKHIRRQGMPLVTHNSDSLQLLYGLVRFLFWRSKRNGRAGMVSTAIERSGNRGRAVS